VHLNPDGSINLIDLTGGGFPSLSAPGGLKLASLSITAKTPRHGSGDGLVNVGAIDATGVDLNKLHLSGSLGTLNVGDGLHGGRALKGWRAGPLPSRGVVAGTLGVLKVKHDITGVLNVPGGPAVDTALDEVAEVFIHKVIIGGDLDGSAGGTKAGLLRVRGSIG